MKANTTFAAEIIPGQIAMDLDAPEMIGTTVEPRSSLFDVVTFREYAPELDDREVLGYILTLTPARDRDSLVERLLDYFGSLKNVLEARPEQLRTVKGIGERTAKLISSFVPVMKTWQRRVNDRPERIGNAREGEAYCKSLVQGLRNEQFWIVCLNAKCDVIGKRKISEGSLSEVSAYPRMVMETALNYNAHSVLLTHNHPGGTCAPSPEDISSTLQLQRLLSGVGIMLLDHIIVANDNTYSMITHGDIDYRTKR